MVERAVTEELPQGYVVCLWKDDFLVQTEGQYLGLYPSAKQVFGSDLAQVCHESNPQRLEHDCLLREVQLERQVVEGCFLLEVVKMEHCDYVQGDDLEDLNDRFSKHVYALLRDVERLA